MARRPSLGQRFYSKVVPDQVDLRDREFEPSVAVVPPQRIGSPAQARKSGFVVWSQGDYSACTGFALANLINILLTRAGRRQEAGVSPFMLYDMARRYDEIPGGQHGSVEAQDTGSSLRGAMKGWYKHGASHRKLWKEFGMPPPQPRAQDDWWQDAARRPLGAYFRVDARSISDMHQALAQSGVLFASAICHAGWDRGYRLTPAQRRGWTIPFEKASPADCGHAFVIVGYDSRGFLIGNSWSSSWGDGGFARLTYEDWNEHAMDCWVAQLGVVTDLHREIARSVSLRVEGGEVRIAADPVLRNREIGPFVIDMENNGRLSRTGDFRTGEADLSALIEVHLKTAVEHWKPADGLIDIAVYAHGGLTGEDTAAATAARWIPALYKAQIFPVFLMWETDLFSTLKNRLQDAVEGVPRATSRLAEGFHRWWNERLERALAKPGSMVWGEMKQNARAIAENPGSGVRLLYKILQEKAGVLPFLKPDRIRLHLIGHSAGTIVHCHILNALPADWRFASVNFLAPAVRCQLFEETALPALRSGRLAHYHQFHLTDAAEQADPTCRSILGYNRSLLCLCSRSFEGGIETPILGMETFFRRRIGSLGLERIESWSTPSNLAACSTHGGFDDDPAVLETVVGLIKRRQVASASTVQVGKPARIRGSREVRPQAALVGADFSGALDGRHMYIFNLVQAVRSAGGPAAFAAQARRARLASVWVKIGYGERMAGPSTLGNMGPIRRALAAAGIRLWGWHEPRCAGPGAARREADAVLSAAKRFDLHGVLMDAESPQGANFFQGGATEAEIYAATLSVGLESEGRALALSSHDIPTNFPAFPFSTFARHAHLNAAQVFYGASPSVARRLQQARAANAPYAKPMIPVGAAWVGAPGTAGCATVEQCVEKGREFIALVKEQQFRGYSFWEWSQAPREFWDLLEHLP